MLVAEELTSNAIRLSETGFVWHAALRDRVEQVCAGFWLGARLESCCGGGCEGEAGHCDDAEEVGGEHLE